VTLYDASGRRISHSVFPGERPAKKKTDFRDVHLETDHGTLVVTSIDPGEGTVTVGQGPSTLLELWEREMRGALEKTTKGVRLAFERLYLTGPWRCPSKTLFRRAEYGGRKGRRAVRRLEARGYVA
jgi:hypothetical protein